MVWVGAAHPAARATATRTTAKPLTRDRIAERGFETRVSSNECAFEDDPSVDEARGLSEEPGRGRRDVGPLGELAQQVDEPPHRTDQVALVAGERLGDDAGPVIVSRCPS